MRKRKYNLEERRGRQGFGWYGDFSIWKGKGREPERFRPYLGTDKRRAKLELERIRAEKEEEKEFKSSSFAEFADHFFEKYCRLKRSWKRDRVSLGHLKDFFRDSSLKEVTTEAVEEYKEKRAMEVGPASVNRELSCLKTLFNKAVLWGRIKRSPVLHVRKLQEPPHRERVLTIKEERGLFEGAASHLKPLLLFLLNTGMRKGEALGLKWEDVDSDSGFIHVRVSKNGRGRNVPMNDAVRTALYARKLGGNAEGFVFDGIKDVKRSFGTARRRAGIKGLHLHDLRHTFATRAVDAGMDIFTLSRVLGHSDIKMTARYYHADLDRAREVMNRLPSAFTTDNTTSSVFAPGSETKSIS